MSTIIWRISKAKYAQTAFDGEGARLWGDFERIKIFEPQPYQFDLRLFQKRGRF